MSGFRNEQGVLNWRRPEQPTVRWLWAARGSSRRRQPCASKIYSNCQKKPWNSGRLIGPKAPLKPKDVWAIRQELKTTKRVRDLALFNCTLDAKLRACDLVKLRVSDVAPGGLLRERSTLIQQKTGRPVLFEITEPTREAVAAWLALRGRRTTDRLFPSRSRAGEHICTRQYARLVDRWVRMIDLDESNRDGLSPFALPKSHLPGIASAAARAGGHRLKGARPGFCCKGSLEPWDIGARSES